MKKVLDMSIRIIEIAMAVILPTTIYYLFTNISIPSFMGAIVGTLAWVLSFVFVICGITGASVIKFLKETVKLTAK